MKKPSPHLKLKLNRETLRSLTEPELTNAVGGRTSVCTNTDNCTAFGCSGATCLC